MFTNKINKLLGVMIIILISLSSSIFSQVGCSFDKWEKDAGAQWWNNNVPENFALSEKQIKKLNKIRGKYSEKILPLQNELWNLQSEFSRYLGQSKIDIRRIKSFRKKIFSYEEKILDLQLKVREKISKILTKEQRKYFYDSGFGWWDVKTNWWHLKSSNPMNKGKHWRPNRHGCN